MLGISDHGTIVEKMIQKQRKSIHADPVGERALLFHSLPGQVFLL